MDAGGGNRAADLLRSIKKMKRMRGEEETELIHGRSDLPSGLCLSLCLPAVMLPVVRWGRIYKQ